MEAIDFKFALNTKVYWSQDGKPFAGWIKRRGYQETWHDDLDDVGGYLSNVFYEIKPATMEPGAKNSIFHESDFGRKVYTDPAAFAEYITSQRK
ncbi:hypothetical protein [Larkinella terrae]|uniref:Uncharacterized protein n=1 Tax=Larkinella terrae TaxID=2025311 RepID=A0A7K0EJ09_9BACT|nr:hypothetical protein [Larkinella terrae]MRS61797.1 hypothetical protein [Larkinella terrae]